MASPGGTSEPAEQPADRIGSPWFPEVVLCHQCVFGRGTRVVLRLLRLYLRFILPNALDSLPSKAAERGALPL